MNVSEIVSLVGLGALLVGTIWLVWRGMARDADDSKNGRDIGGGPGDGGGLD